MTAATLRAWATAGHTTTAALTGRRPARENRAARPRRDAHVGAAPGAQRTRRPAQGVRGGGCAHTRPAAALPRTPAAGHPVYRVGRAPRTTQRPGAGRRRGRRHRRRRPHRAAVAPRTRRPTREDTRLMVHNLIAAAVLAALAGLWWYSGIVARLNRGDTALLARADAQPAETEQVPPWRAAPWVTGTGEHPTIGTQPVCGCGGRRCRAHREGADCLTAALAERPAYWRRIPAGRHTTGLAVARWLAGDWWQADLPVRLRRELGRLAGAGTIPAGVS